MPIYEYRCERGHTFDCLQRMSDEAISECTVCAAPAQRVLSAPAIHFKGSGFYSTDYGKGGRKAASSEESASINGSSNGAKKESSTSSSSDSSSSSSSESSKAKSGSGSGSGSGSSSGSSSSD